MDPFAWTCPYCNRDTTILHSNYSNDAHGFDCGNKDGQLALRTYVIVCPNPKCKEFTIRAALYKTRNGQFGIETLGAPFLTWALKPLSGAKPQPTYVPQPIRDDYLEACATLSASAKASATLSRRCLQGMIRDFWGISRNRLIEEINALTEKVDPITWKAIDGVRSIGNIGAHMEKDINVIVDVDPGEAEILIGLIETLLKEWYVHRHEREQQMQKVIDSAAAKREQQSPPKGKG